MAPLGSPPSITAGLISSCFLTERASHDDKRQVALGWNMSTADPILPVPLRIKSCAAIVPK
jgi:hypothetical protein